MKKKYINPTLQTVNIDLAKICADSLSKERYQSGRISNGANVLNKKISYGSSDDNDWTNQD